MRDYKEIAERVRQRGDEMIAEKKRRNAVIMRIAFPASGLCAAVIIGVGLWHSSAVRNAIEPHTPPNVVIGTEASTGADTTTQHTGDEVIDTTAPTSENTGNEIIVTTVSDEYHEHISVITKTSGASPASPTVTTATTAKSGRSASTQTTTTARRNGSSPAAATSAKSPATTTARVTNAVQTTAVQITTVSSDSGCAAINTTVTYKPPVTIPEDIPVATTTQVYNVTTSAVPMATTVTTTTTRAFGVTTATHTTTAIAYTFTTTASPTTTTTAEPSSGIIKDELPADADYDDITLPDGKTYAYSGWRWYAYDLTYLYDTELQYRLYGGIESVTAAVKVYYMSDSSVLVGYDESGILLEFDCT